MTGVETKSTLFIALILSAPSMAQDRGPNRAQEWRDARRLIDFHMHLGEGEEFLERAVRVMDQVGIGVGVNLSGGPVTSREGERSPFERNKVLADQRFPGRFVHSMNLDFSHLEREDFSEHLAAQVEKGFGLGAAGLKIYKQLGLYLSDSRGELVKVDDPRLDAAWAKCGELGMPVSIHVGDPKAFWLPYDSSNERWEELRDHPDWWFGDPKKFPPREELLEALNRVIARHPGTTFIGVHFANNPEDIDKVGEWFERFPNLRADLAARVPELGRHEARKVHEFFVKYQDRIVFATDFMVYDRFILGSGGRGPPPTETDAIEFYRKHWRWMETWDEDFEHMTPIQGNWRIDAIGLPQEVLRKVYFDNARKLMKHVYPAPELVAEWVSGTPDADLTGSQAQWRSASPVYLEYQSANAEARPALSTEVRALWTADSLFLRFVCPFRKLTVFEPVSEEERIGLWERDVVEAFIGWDPSHPHRYREIELAPTGELLDVAVDLPQKDFAWSSQATGAVKIDKLERVFTATLRIPFAAFEDARPASGSSWRVNLFRCDRSGDAALALNPTLTDTFHRPERFTTLWFKGSNAAADAQGKDGP